MTAVVRGAGGLLTSSVISGVLDALASLNTTSERSTGISSLRSHHQPTISNRSCDDLKITSKHLTGRWTCSSLQIILTNLTCQLGQKVTQKYENCKLKPSNEGLSIDNLSKTSLKLIDISHSIVAEVSRLHNENLV